jgi:hypothetical protein
MVAERTAFGIAKSVGWLLILKSVFLKSQFLEIASKLLDGTMLSAVGSGVNKKSYRQASHPFL